MKPTRSIKDKNYLSNWIKGDMNNYFDNFETKIENNLKSFLSNLEIRSSVKTDKFSLPYTNEIITTLYMESYINAVFDYKRIYRKITKELLNKGVEKIRFYMWIDSKNDFNPMNGGISYHFRYYIHEIERNFTPVIEWKIPHSSGDGLTQVIKTQKDADDFMRQLNSITNKKS